MYALPMPRLLCESGFSHALQFFKTPEPVSKISGRISFGVERIRRKHRDIWLEIDLC